MPSDDHSYRTQRDASIESLALQALRASLTGDASTAAEMHTRIAQAHDSAASEAAAEGNGKAAKRNGQAAALHRQAARLLQEGDRGAYGEATGADPDERLVEGRSPTANARCIPLDDIGPTPPTLNQVLTGQRFAASGLTQNDIPGGQPSGSLADPDLARKARGTAPDTAGGDEGDDEYTRGYPSGRSEDMDDGDGSQVGPGSGIPFSTSKRASVNRDTDPEDEDERDEDEADDEDEYGPDEGGPSKRLTRHLRNAQARDRQGQFTSGGGPMGAAPAGGPGGFTDPSTDDPNAPDPHDPASMAEYRDRMMRAAGLKVPGRGAARNAAYGMDEQYDDVDVRQVEADPEGIDPDDENSRRLGLYEEPEGPRRPAAADYIQEDDADSYTEDGLPPPNTLSKIARNARARLKAARARRRAANNYVRVSMAVRPLGYEGINYNPTPRTPM
jgi:hypothetical protein